MGEVGGSCPRVPAILFLGLPDPGKLHGFMEQTLATGSITRYNDGGSRTPEVLRLLEVDRGMVMEMKSRISPRWRYRSVGVPALTAAAVWLLVPAAQSQNAQVGEPGDAAAAARHQQMIQTYCIGCHNDKARTGDLSLEGRNLAEAASNPDVWEKVLQKLNGGLMPPRGMPRPPQETLDAFTDWVELTLDDAALAKGDPGRAPVHRLNRTEYGNAIRDLLAVTVDPSEYLPPDTESDGFDNIADALRVSPTLIDQYLTASGKIAEVAVGDMDIKPLSSMIQVPPDLAQGEHIPGLPLGTRGGAKVMYNFPLDAEYDFNVFLFQNIVGYVTGLEYPHTLEISIDGERVFSAPVGGEEDNLMSDTNLGVAKDTLDERLQARIPVKAGRREVVVTFVQPRFGRVR